MSPDPIGLVLLPHSFDVITECRRRSAAETAALAQTTPATISRIRSGRRGASEELAQRIAAALEVPPAAIFPQLAGWTPPEVTL